MSIGLYSKPKIPLAENCFMPKIAIGDQEIDINETSVVEIDNVSIRYDPAQITPMFLSTEKYEQLCLLLGVPQLADFPDRSTKGSGKKYAKHVREGTQALSEVFYMIVSSPDFNGDGVTVRYTEDETTEEEEEEETDVDEA